MPERRDGADGPADHCGVHRDFLSSWGRGLSCTGCVADERRSTRRARPRGTRGLTGRERRRTTAPARRAATSTSSLGTPWSAPFSLGRGLPCGWAPRPFRRCEAGPGRFSRADGMVRCGRWRPCRRGAGRAGSVRGRGASSDREDVGGVEVGDTELVEPVQADPQLRPVAGQPDPLGEIAGVPRRAAGGGVAGEGLGEHGGGRPDDREPPVDVVAVGAVRARGGVGAHVEDVWPRSSVESSGVGMACLSARGGGPGDRRGGPTSPNPTTVPGGAVPVVGGSPARAASVGSACQPEGLGPERTRGLTGSGPATHHCTRPQGGNVLTLSARRCRAPARVGDKLCSARAALDAFRPSVAMDT